jgi:hypothetical protein
LRVFKNLNEKLFLGFEVPIKNPLPYGKFIDNFGDGSWVVPVGGEAAGGEVHKLGSSFLASRGKSSLFHVVEHRKADLD